MANFKVTLEKTGKSKTALQKAGPGNTITDLVLMDDQNGNVTVVGVDKMGNKADISAVATITASSSDPAVLTTSIVSAAVYNARAVGPTTVPGSPVNVSVLATWNDGSIGPFSFTVPYDIVPGPVTGIIVVPGTPVPN